jgi:hypothetical protein
VQLGGPPDHDPPALGYDVVQDDPDPAGQPLEDVQRRRPRIEVGGEAVQRRHQRREHLVEPRTQLLDEAVVLVDPGQARAEREGTVQTGDTAPHGRIRTWWS